MKRFALLTVAGLAGLLALPAAAQNLGPLVEISRANAVGSCDDGSNFTAVDSQNVTSIFARRVGL